MPRVRFLTEQITVDVPAGATIRDVAIQAGVEIYRGMWTHMNCRGNGICGRCSIWMMSPEDRVSAPSVRERFHAVKGKSRLACQVRVMGDVDIRTRPLGPAVARELEGAQPAYLEVAEQRYQEAKEEERKKAELAEKKAELAEKKAKAEAAAKKKAEEEAKKAGAEAATEANDAEQSSEDADANEEAASPG